ncbi:unnamed protein product [Thlaspi arvense]|uniref:Uncharacterized protein n=1 Tax=Thlaspi arvense TaxID=13288 RepID=A0AAU9T0S8_THLAR|nr:unnamed protein product [Thlaspi arvense]
MKEKKTNPSSGYGVSDKKSDSKKKEIQIKGKTERVVPEHELRRLRNVALRTKVGSAGITQAPVEADHEKWEVDEVVKPEFSEPFSHNMKRTHETVERISDMEVRKLMQDEDRETHKKSDGEEENLYLRVEMNLSFLLAR